MPDLEPPASSDDDPIEPLGGLSRLTASVDGDAATSAFNRLRRRRSHRRRAVAGLGVVAVFVAGAVVVSAAVGGDDDDRRTGQVVAGPDGGGGGGDRTSTPTDTTAVPVVASDVEDHGLRLELEAPRSGVVGTRIRLTVRMRNVSSETIQIGTASGCTDPVGVSLVPSTSTDSSGGPSLVPGTNGQWDGDLSTLSEHLRDTRGNPSSVATDVDAIGVRSLVCPTVLLPPISLEPDQEVVQEMALDLRWGTGRPTADQVLLVQTGGRGAGGQEKGAELRVPFRLDDDPDRSATVDAAVDPGGIPSAPTLEDWVALTLPVPNGGVQTYETDLTWWQGYWELWIDPKFSDGNVSGPLRIRWEADRGRVTDVRMVWTGNGGADDDPDAPDDGGPPDQVRYHLD